LAYFEEVLFKTGFGIQAHCGGFPVNLEDTKLIYILSCAVLIVVILSPTLFSVLSFPEGEQFTELYVLNSNRMAEGYPFNVTANTEHPYTVVLGVGNHEAKLSSYLVYVKLRNQTESLPDATAGTPSALAPIFEYRLILDDGGVWESEVTFSFDEVSFVGKESRISLIQVDGHSVSVDKVSVWNGEKQTFFYQLFFELWIYNATRSVFEFHNRSVGFTLNLTNTQ
jgi:hypothetical protein